MIQLQRNFNGDESNKITKEWRQTSGKDKQREKNGIGIQHEWNWNQIATDFFAFFFETEKKAVKHSKNNYMS